MDLQGPGEKEALAAVAGLGLEQRQLLLLLDPLREGLDREVCPAAAELTGVIR